MFQLFFLHFLHVSKHRNTCACMLCSSPLLSFSFLRPAPNFLLFPRPHILSPLFNAALLRRWRVDGYGMLLLHICGRYLFLFPPACVRYYCMCIGVYVRARKWKELFFQYRIIFVFRFGTFTTFSALYIIHRVHFPLSRDSSVFPQPSFSPLGIAEKFSE